jgi:hypothetical protein
VTKSLPKSSSAARALWGAAAQRDIVEAMFAALREGYRVM